VCSSFFTRPSDDEPGAVFGPHPTSILLGMDLSLTQASLSFGVMQPTTALLRWTLF